MVGVCHKGYVLPPSNTIHTFTTRCLHNQTWSITRACTRKTSGSIFSLKMVKSENPDSVPNDLKIDKVMSSNT